jgi:multidrug efflux pump subunit AcrA (membrane-fusion protein)
VTGETAALRVLRLASPVAGRVTVLNVRAGDRLAAGEVAARVIPLENEAALHGFAWLDSNDAPPADEHATARRLRRQLAGHDVPLRTPFAAVVADRLHNPDEQVAPTDVLLELFDPDSLYVVAQVPVDEIGRVRVGMPVSVSHGGGGADGTVAALLTSLAPQTLTVPVRISLSTPLQPPLLHAAVQARITAARHADTLLIPRTAVLSSTVGQEGLVMVAAEGHAEQRSLQLGLRNHDEIEVTAGLREGDVVLVDGQYALPNGTRIEPLPVTE